MQTLGLILFFVVCVGTVFGQPNGEQEFTIHKDSRFSLSYPADWKRTEPVEPPYSLRIYDSKAALLTLNVIASYDESRKSKSAEVFVNEWPASLGELEEGYRRQQSSTKIVSSGSRRLGDLSAFYVKAKATLRIAGHERETVILQVQTIKAGYMYTITFSYEAERETRDLPIFEKIASTFIAKG